MSNVGDASVSSAFNPFDPASSDRVARTTLRTRANRALATGARYTTVLGFVSVAVLLVQRGLGRVGFEIPIAFAACCGLFSLLLAVLADRRLIGGWLSFAVFGCFVSIPTVFLLVSHAVLPFGAATYINGPMTALFFVVVGVTGFLYDGRLCVFTGLVGGLGHQLVAWLAQPQLMLVRVPDPVAAADLQDITIYSIESGLIAFAGMLAGALAVFNRRLLLSTVKKAYERGSYRLVQRIGQGGMGEIWAAEHQMLARPAAVKLIRATDPEQGSRSDGDGGARASPAALQLFEREAQATSTLRSPHTVEIYDFGLSDDGTFFYVMELLDGLDLETLVRQFGPLEPARVVHLVRQACHSLHEAHERGLVHRDVKPANLFVCRYGLEVDFVKVLDFGLVRATSETTRTQPWGAGAPVDGVTVGVAGTPAFMAPEVILGRAAGRRSDVYALGCVAYWLLTGTRVYEAPTVAELLACHLHETPVPPSKRAEVALPAALDDVVVSCLAKAPDDRPATAADLSARLAALGIESEWTDARRDTWWHRHAPAGVRPIAG